MHLSGGKKLNETRQPAKASLCCQLKRLNLKEGRSVVSCQCLHTNKALRATYTASKGQVKQGETPPKSHHLFLIFVNTSFQMCWPLLYFIQRPKPLQAQFAPLWNCDCLFPTRGDLLSLLPPFVSAT